LQALLARRWPDRDPAALRHIVHCLLPLVQVPPRGLWERSGQATLTTLSAWAGPPPASAMTLDDLVLRYLGAFGPASIADAQKWSGLTRLAPVFERLRPRLVTFLDETGTELFDEPDAPRPDGGMPVPVRFLSEFDNMLLAHADRRRILDEADRARVFTANGIVRATILVDGFVASQWRIERERDGAVLVIQPFRPVAEAARAMLEREGTALLAFTAPRATRRTIRFAEPVRPV
jgi:hypothetical protein